jgi:16S rRNA processing protein RimM
MKVRSYTEPRESILEYETWQVGRKGHWTAVRVEDGRVTSRGVLAKLEGVDSPEQARIQIGRELGVWRNEMPPLAPGEYYWSDLEGLDALGANGEVLGRVDHFRSTPGGTLVVIRGEREHWVPFAKDRIVSVDLDAQRIVFDWQSDW